MFPLSSGVCFCMCSILIPSILNRSYCILRHAGSWVVISLPFLCEYVLYAHQTGHSGLNGNVGDIGLPELVRLSWTEDIPGFCSTPVLRCRKAQIVILQYLPYSFDSPLYTGSSVLPRLFCNRMWAFRMRFPWSFLWSEDQGVPNASALDGNNIPTARFRISLRYFSGTSIVSDLQEPSPCSLDRFLKASMTSDWSPIIFFRSWISSSLESEFFPWSSASFPPIWTVLSTC